MTLFTKVLFSLVLLIAFNVYVCNERNGKRSFLSELIQNFRPERRELLLTVYYEGKCSDTVSFILKQLVPTMQKLKDYVSLKFVPFGKANSIQGGKSFQCQHGPTECLSNLIMDCSLNYLMNAPDLVKLDYVACEMKTFAASQGSLQCINNNPAVRTCANSQKGVSLQLHSEYLTKQLAPNFIPSITLNGVFDPNTQNSAMNDLFGVLCTRLGNIPPCK